MFFFRTEVGRLGNQMFVYAFAIALSKRTGINYCLSRIGDLAYFKLSPGEATWLNRVKNNLYHRWIKKRCEVLEYEALDISSFRHFNYAALHVQFMGYFQSPYYFSDAQEVIRQRFQLKNKYVRAFQAYKKQNGIPDEYIVIHVRRTDYAEHRVNGLDSNNSIVLPVEYYKKALDRLGQRTELVVLVSDDPTALESDFSFIKNRFVSKSSWLIDFQLLQNAKICIIANSTFSWWAAWLNKDAMVLCPKYFLGFNERIEIPVKIYPKHWIQIE